MFRPWWRVALALVLGIVLASAVTLKALNTPGREWMALPGAAVGRLLSAVVFQGRAFDLNQPGFDCALGTKLVAILGTDWLFYGAIVYGLVTLVRPGRA